MSPSRKPLEVAVLLPDDKERKLSLMQRCSQSDIQDVLFTRIGGIDELVNSGDRYSAILHKLHTDLLQAASGEYPEAAGRIALLRAWLADRGPGVVMLDPLDGLERMLLRRLDQCRAMQLCSEVHADRVFVPRFQLLHPGDTLRCQLAFPLLCKPHSASGPGSHDMSLVFGAEQLAECAPRVGGSGGGGDFVAQEFHNHGGRLIKVYVLGNALHACVRPSLRDFPPGHPGPALNFSSHAVSKAGCRSDLSMATAAPASLATGDAEPPSNGDSDAQLIARFGDLLEPLATTCRRVLGLDLINLDLLPVGDKLALVDINQFPGFESMPDFLPAMAQLVREKCGPVGK